MEVRVPTNENVDVYSVDELISLLSKVENKEETLVAMKVSDEVLTLVTGVSYIEPIIVLE